MKHARSIAMWAALLATALLIVLSIIGACCGAERARELFNSVPLAIFWSLLVVLLIAGFFLFERLRRSAGLVAIHLGCLSILLGSMLSSADGHAFLNRWGGAKKIPAGYMAIGIGQADNIVRDRYGSQIGTLPFQIGLKDFRLEHYATSENWLLVLDTAPAGDGHLRRQKLLDWVVGSEQELPFVDARLKVLRYLPRPATTSNDGRTGPAMEVLLSRNGRQMRAWLRAGSADRAAAVSLEPLLGSDGRAGHNHDRDTYLFMTPGPRPIKDYKSCLTVIEDGLIVGEKTIEVNYPLHYGGHHFYQNSYDRDHGRYTILAVRSDSGLVAVYVGFALLCAGIFWRLWWRPAWDYLLNLKRRSHGD